MQHSIQQEIKGVFLFVAAIWGVFLLEYVMPFDIRAFGLTPRTFWGLLGIVTMPFLHGNLQHIVANTLPLFVLLMLLAGSRAGSRVVVAVVILLGGALLWIFGRSATHIGASGLICGLITFLVVSGVREQRFMSMAVAGLVTFLYGGSLFLGVVPHFGSQTSWDGHLMGAIAGCIAAILFVGNSRGSKRENG